MGKGGRCRIVADVRSKRRSKRQDARTRCADKGGRCRIVAEERGDEEADGGTVEEETPHADRCEKHPLCTRGYKHMGKGGRCRIVADGTFKEADEEADGGTVEEAIEEETPHADRCEKHPLCTRGYKHMGKGGRCSINPLARKRAREYDDDVLQGQGGGGEEEEPDTDQDMLDRSQVEDMEKQEEKEAELAGSGWISQLGRAWALSAALDRQMDVSVETAFIACCVRTRKGGLARLSPLERRMVESFKILLWGYVAQTSRLSMRHLKIDAAIDDLVRQNAAEQAAIDDLSANDDSGEGWSGGDKLGDVGKLKGGKRSSGKGSSGKGSSGKGSSGKTADGGAADEGDLSNVNLADGLVVDGYQFLIRHLASEPLADGSIPIGPVVGAPRGAAINDGEDEDSLHLRRTASSFIIWTCVSARRCARFGKARTARPSCSPTGRWSRATWSSSRFHSEC